MSAAVSMARFVGLVSLGLSECLLAQSAALRFSSTFGDDMVLPHDVPFSVNGRAAPGSELVLDVAGVSYTTVTDRSGAWQAVIAPLRAGGPYEIRISDNQGQQRTLSNVLAGEIWLCSGQSNMAYSVAASVDQPEEYEQGIPAIRLLSVPNRAELETQAEFPEPVPWVVASDSNVPRFSAVCYFAARRMFEHDGIPRGLINASWGGSAIEAWVSERGLIEVDGFGHKVSQLQLYRENQRAAELAFADDWLAWWQTSSDQGPVWERGVLDENGDWRDAPLVNWKTYPDERLANHHGIVWFSTQFELSAAQSRRRATFVLGKIDEVDTTWINGKFVNNTFGYGSKREYPLETGVLEAGTNPVCSTA